MKLKDYIVGLQEMLKKNPEFSDLSVAYASDDEGNAYHKIHSLPSLCQVEDIKSYYLEMIGFYDENPNESEIKKEDINCVIIN